MRRVTSVSLVIVAMILAAGSSRDFAVADAAGRASLVQAKTAPPALGDACSLLTMQDAAAALGEAVKEPKSTSGVQPGGAIEAASSCEYTGSGLSKVNLNLMRLSSATATAYQAFCAQKGREGLSGLGNVACWYDEKHAVLQVLKGTTFFSIELRKSGNPTEAIKGVAKKVFDQLK